MIRRNTASQVIHLPALLLTADGAAVTSGATLSVVKDGSSAASAGTLTHVSGGVWSYTPTQAETDAAIVALILTATSATPVVVNLVTTAADTSATAFGANTITPPTTAEIEAALVNEGDATALLQAIADKIAGDLTAGDLSALAIVSAIKADATLAQMISRIDATVSSRSSHDDPDLSSLATATALTSATDLVGYVLAVLAGTISNGSTTTNTFTITVGSDTYTVTLTGVTETGVRAGVTLTKA